MRCRRLGVPSSPTICFGDLTPPMPTSSQVDSCGHVSTSTSLGSGSPFTLTAIVQSTRATSVSTFPRLGDLSPRKPTPGMSSDPEQLKKGCETLRWYAATVEAAARSLADKTWGTCGRWRASSTGSLGSGFAARGFPTVAKGVGPRGGHQREVGLMVRRLDPQSTWTSPLASSTTATPNFM